MILEVDPAIIPLDQVELPDHAASPIVPFKGYVDFYGYHSLSGGWFFAGWITHTGELDKLPQDAVAQFADEEISDHVSSLLFMREDVVDHGIGFLLFLRAASATRSPLRYLTIELEGVAQHVSPVFEACLLPESRLMPLLCGILAANDDSVQRQEMTLLVTGGRNAEEQGYIEYLGYHATAGGWFLSGWVSPGWGNSQGPERAFISFDEDDVRGEAIATLYSRQELPQGAFGVVFFVRSPPLSSGPLNSFSFHIDGVPVTLKPILSTPKLREAELVARLRANLAQAKSSRTRERLLNLLSRRLYSGEDTLSALGPAISLYVDEAILCAQAGMVLMGWMLAKPGLIRHILVRCGEHCVPVNPNEWVKVERHDVLAEFIKHGFDNADCGFIAFLPGVFEVGEPIYLEVETESGVVGYRGIPQPSRTDIAAIKQVLGSVEVRFADIQGAYDRVLGPAVAALNRGRLASRPEVRVIEYGVMPRNPRFSVIVPLYGRLDFVEYQLALSSAHPQCADTEFIYVLDDPPKRQEAQMLFASVYERFLIPFRAVLLERNVGFAPANNIGLQHARGTFIAYLNSDVFPGTLDWLERLADDLLADPTLGAVGPLLLYEDGSVQHRGMYFERLPELGNWFFCQHYDKGLRYSRGDQLQRFISITGACMVMRRDLANQLGGFDETYVIGDFEDSDLCLKIQEMGLGCAIDPKVELFHLERKSQNFTAHNWRLNLTAYNAWQHERRWGKTIAEKQALEHVL